MQQETEKNRFLPFTPFFFRFGRRKEEEEERERERHTHTHIHTHKRRRCLSLCEEGEEEEEQAKLFLSFIISFLLSFKSGKEEETCLRKETNKNPIFSDLNPLHCFFFLFFFDVGKKENLA